jgi:hypothetical protein
MVAVTAVVWTTYSTQPATVSDTAASVAVSAAPAEETSPSVRLEPSGANGVTHEPPITRAPMVRPEPPLDAAPEPQIIVDAREAKALQELVTRIGSGRLDASRLPALTHIEELHAAEIVIPPISVPLLAFAADIHTAAEELE